MTYTNPERNTVTEAAPVDFQPVEYHDKIRWGPVLAGLVIALGTQLLLSALGAALGFSTIASSGSPRSDAPDVGNAVGIWSLLSAFISLFVGGWFLSRLSGPLTRNSALLNGAVLWATTLALGSWLLASGVSGALGLAVPTARTAIQQATPGSMPTPTQLPRLTAEQTRELAANAAKAGWTFSLSSLAGLAAALFGSSTGIRREQERREEERRATT